jgi:hypothetical protein
MSHHGFEAPEDGNSKPFNDIDQFKKLKELTELIEKFNSSSLGATGKFPDGKLNDNDDGEIRFSLTVQDGKLIIFDFGKNIKWIGFTKKEAIQIRDLLNEKIEELKDEI